MSQILDMKKITSITLTPTENGCIANVSCDYGEDRPMGDRYVEHKYNCDAELFNYVKGETIGEGAEDDEEYEMPEEKPKVTFNPKNLR